MNTFLQMIAFSNEAGGLFDFNGTLPLMAIQFILLTTALTFLFYKPIAKTLEQRETFINDNLASASEKLLKANELCQQYEEQLKEAKLSAQSIVTTAQNEAKEIVSGDINEARNATGALLDKTNKELEEQKKVALEKLEVQIDELSQLIKEKLVGSALDR